MANDLVAANTPEQKLCWAFKVFVPFPIILYPSHLFCTCSHHCCTFSHNFVPFPFVLYLFPSFLYFPHKTRAHVLKFQFNVYFVRYDLDNSGAIDKVEMVKVMEAIYSMVDGNMKVK